jgi:uncharacterized protein with PIN domain
MRHSVTKKEAAFLRHNQIRAKEPHLHQAGGKLPRFVADVMLGRLAKWLRIAGFDVLYSNSYSDDELIALSNGEGRILLSLDTRLLIRKSVRQFVFLESQNVQDQIRQILRATRIKHLSSLLTRCLNCNETLIDIAREDVRNSVPKYVYETHYRFKSCPKCRRIFWAGSHRRSVHRTLGKILRAAVETSE